MILQRLNLPAMTPTLRKRLLRLGLLAVCGATVYGLLVRLDFLMPPSVLPAVLCLTNCQETPLHSLAHPSLQADAILNNGKPLLELLEDKRDREKISLLVEKGNYRLTVFYDLQPVKSYPVVFGSSPTGDKLAEGDQKTPEGIYRIRDRYPHSAWSKFIWLDYPTPQDWREHFQAKLRQEIGPLATIGSEIGIHGVPSGADGLIAQQDNWTWGCVSLQNEAVDELYQVVQQGTVVEIVP